MILFDNLGNLDYPPSFKPEVDYPITIRLRMCPKNIHNHGDPAWYSKLNRYGQNIWEEAEVKRSPHEVMCRLCVRNIHVY